MKTVLDPREHLRVALKDLDDLRVGLLHHANGPRHPLGPSRKTGAMVWGPEEGDTQRLLNDVLEMRFPPLFRLDQSLSFVSAEYYFGGGGAKFTSSQTSPPKLWHTKMIGRSFLISQQSCLAFPYPSKEPTVSSSSRYRARDVNRFQA